MLFYVFVAFLWLNNNTILAMQNIEFGLVSSDRYPDPAENASIEAIPILNIRSAHPYSVLLQVHRSAHGMRISACAALDRSFSYYNTFV